jgi:hypothetical protein
VAEGTIVIIAQPRHCMVIGRFLGPWSSIGIMRH